MIAMYPHNRTWKSNQKQRTLAEHNRLVLCLLFTTIGLNIVVLLTWMLGLVQ